MIKNLGVGVKSVMNFVAFVINTNRNGNSAFEAVEEAKFVAREESNNSIAEVAKFKA